ncbi:MAG TPA: PspC domain-containing protein [Cyclobacteriaceae bacterium]|nr:PspC domain-containing protein [Cyclobacteriaceae bacterium]
MKKNISINISGIIFHIEEDGYETLRKYLDSVNRYFAAFDDSSEILADIEGRIAEIFLSRLNEGKQVITAEDVSTLIATMGSVSDFKAAEEQEFAQDQGGPETGQEKKSSGTSASKKLFRDNSRKILGGVCSGLAHYFNIDPVWPRLLLALLVLGSYGSVLIVYIILWILLPVSNLEEEPSLKKMYRNPDKKVIGGVASGIAAFFGIDLTLVRIILVITAIFGGLGILLYIILWIALPEAKTITEKMQMQGEPVTLSNIESSVKKSLNEKEASEESTLAKIILFPFRALAAVITALGNALGPLFKMLVDVLRVAIGLIITLTGVCMLFSLLFFFGILVGIFNAPDWAMFSNWYAPNLPLDAIRNSFPTWTVVFTFLAALIPALFILLIGNSIIVRRLVFNQYVGWSLFIAFFISVAVISFSLPHIILSFKEEGEYKTEQLFTTNGKIPVLRLTEVGLDDYNVTSLTLRGYDGKDIKVVERFQAQGPTRKIAGENAQMVTYTVAQSDSIISFDSNITFLKDAKFNAQRLDVDIFIPTDQNFVVDAKLWRLIDTDVISGNFRYHYSLNEDTHTWKMTGNGIQCVSCPVEKDVITSTDDQFGLKDFTSIELKGIFNTRIEKGDQFSVALTGSNTLRNDYDVYVNGETLVIENKNNRRIIWKKKFIEEDELRLTITLPELKDLDVTGAGKLKFVGFTGEEMDVNLTGAIRGEGEVYINSLNVKLTGASLLELSGKGLFMDADIVGASGLRAYGYEVAHCIVEAHGASSAKVNATEKLEIKKGVASSVSHRGNPEIIKR